MFNLRKMFKGGAEGLIANTLTSYDLGLRLARKSDMTGKQQSDFGVIHAFRTVYRTSTLPHYIPVGSIDNPFSFLHEIAPFLYLTPAVAKEAFAHYCAYILYRHDPAVNLPLLKMALVDGARGLQRTEPEMYDDFNQLRPMWPKVLQQL